MQITETNTEGLKRELKVVVAADELDKKLATRLEEIKGQVQIKGFRPGKVPVAHIRKVYGKSLMAEVIQQTVNDASKKVLEDSDERPAFEPKIEMTEDEKEIEAIIDGKADLAYTMSYEVIPAIEVSDLAAIKLEKEVAKVDEKEIDEGIDRLRDNGVTYEEKKDAAEDGDQVKIDFVGRIDGEAFEGGTADDVPLVIGSGSFIPGFEEQLVGAKAGEEKKVDVTFPDDYQAKDLAGKNAVFEVKVNGVARPKVPELDDAFAATLGVESVDKLREAVSGQIEQEYAKATRSKLKRKLLDALAETHNFDLPPTLVDQEFDAIWREVTQRMAQADRSFEDEDTTEEEARKDYREAAERRVRLGLLLSEIGNKNDIKVTDEEVQKALMERVQQFPGQEKMVFEYYQKNPQAVAELRAPVFEEKVVDFIVELADVTEKTVSPEELFKSPDDDEEETASAS